MTIEISLQEKNIPLLFVPHFSDYSGGNAFIFREKIYQRRGDAIGSGSYGEVFCFEADDHTKLAVKSEILFNHAYRFGYDFQREAALYQKIYGLGVFSGNIKNQFSPHFILMPYFEGKTLYHFPYPSAKDVFFCWIKTADAVNQLHQQHQIVHCDLKSDNVIFGNRADQLSSPENRAHAFVIDFGFTVSAGSPRNFFVSDTAVNRASYTQYAPEVFTQCKKRMLADPAQDIFSLGELLWHMYVLHSRHDYVRSASRDAIITLHDVRNNLTTQNPKERWSIAKAIYMLATSFFSHVPRQTWIMSMNEIALNKQCSDKLMRTIWQSTSMIALQVRRDELEMEQAVLEEENKKSTRKEQKIKGLRLLQSDICIDRPELLEATVARVKIKFPKLTAGVFSRRTEVLLDELTELAPVFH